MSSLENTGALAAVRKRSRRCATSKYGKYAFARAPCARARRAQKGGHVKSGAVVLGVVAMPAPYSAARATLAFGARNRVSLSEPRAFTGSGKRLFLGTARTGTSRACHSCMDDPTFLPPSRKIRI